jgi:hypothetical protein
MNPNRNKAEFPNASLLQMNGMLRIFDDRQPMNRRELLRVGGLSLGGLSLASLLSAKAVGGKPNPLTGKSVIFLFQQGGPSQLETFDPKPDAPSGIRTVGGTIRTSVPGVHFGATMQQLAKLAHKLNVVRSFTTKNAGHNIQPIVSDASKQANIGVHFARVAGATRADTGMPTTAVLFPRSVDATVPGPSARGNLSATGPFGQGFAPFIPGKGGQLQEDMKLSLPRERFLNDRKSLLAELDRLNREADANGQITALDDIQQQAYEVLLGGGVSKALDLSREDARTLAMYDTTKYSGGTRWDKVRRGKAGLYNAQADTIGKLLLQARRLCEAGCGFVTIHASYAGVWDMHADGNNLGVREGMEAVGLSFDHAVAAFIRDCEARGLSDKILLVCCGEMGRNPRLNKRGGRDHWSRLAPLLLYGGGMGGGKVIGQSDKQGGEPNSKPYGPSHLISTILRTVMDPGQVRLIPGLPQEVNQLLNHAPIDGLGVS